MTYEVIDKVENLFKDKEQWEDFLTIANQRNPIKDAWWRKFSLEINKTIKAVDNWGYSSINQYDSRWYINEFGVDSLCFITGNIWNKYSICLWAPQNKYDLKALSFHLQEGKYSEPIKNKFDRLHYIGNENTQEKFVEHIIPNQVSENEVFDLERLAWYANYQTTELVTLVIVKINRFREDKEIYDILKYLNTETKLK
jgi:hypothetical protein